MTTGPLCNDCIHFEHEPFAIGRCKVFNMRTTAARQIVPHNFGHGDQARCGPNGAFFVKASQRERAARARREG